MYPSHSYFWSGSSWLDWCEERFTTNLMSQALSWFLAKFDEFHSGRWLPIVNIAYCFIGRNQAKSTGIHGGAHPRFWRVTAFAHLFYKLMPNPLWWQHRFWLVFWPHAFISTQPCSIIQIMWRCKSDKAKTNTCHVMWLVRVVLFKDCPSSLIAIFTLPFKKKAMFCTKALATDPFSSTFMNCWLWFYYWFRRGLYPKSLQPERTLVSPVEPASRTSPVELHEGLGLLMVSNSSVQHVAWEIFSPSRFE